MHQGYYVVTAVRVTWELDEHGRAWTKTKQLPTFFLHSAVQGIVDKGHAEKIARDILAGQGHINVSVDEAG